MHDSKKRTPDSKITASRIVSNVQRPSNISGSRNYSNFTMSNTLEKEAAVRVEAGRKYDEHLAIKRIMLNLEYSVLVYSLSPRH